MTYPYIKEQDSTNHNCPMQPGECLGSRCMAWRWKKEYDYPPAPYPPRLKGYSVTLGFCGMVTQ